MRTNDQNLLLCPICFKTPHMKFHQINYGKVYCNGELLHRHRMISTGTVGYCQPSVLVKEMIDKWNDVVTNEHLIALNIKGIEYGTEKTNQND